MEAVELVFRMHAGLPEHVCAACGSAVENGEEYVAVDGDPVHLDCALEDDDEPVMLMGLDT